MKVLVKGIIHFFWKLAHFYHSPRVKQLSFTVFKCIQLIFLIFRRISVTRQFLVSLTSIVGKKIYKWKSMRPETVLLIFF